MSLTEPQQPQGRLSIRTIAMPGDTNPFGNVFGGWLMSQMDLAGGTHALHRVQGRVVTVAADAMEFHLPVLVGDEVTCYTQVVRVGKTSLSIRVEAWIRRRCMAAVPLKVTTGTFTYVAVDEHGNKCPVPPEPVEG